MKTTIDKSDIYLNEEIVEALAKQMAEELDFGVMCSLYKELGWTQVKLSWPKNMTESGAHEIKEWCRHNLTGHYKGQGGTWIFESPKDASLFILRWV